jgi:translation initiation factor IF-2
MDRKSKDIIKSLLTKGVMATINQPLDAEASKKICNEFGFRPNILSFEENIVQEEEAEKVKEDTAADLVSRAPVVTMMGHVDHGKTSLLDAIRETAVVESEHGGITQHIGAYHVDLNDRRVVFLDTPGHEAFTRMRARGAQVTDIVVLVVAADDGVMPQTIEAIHHAKEAGVPIVVALNKIDKPEANPDRVRKDLASHEVLVEDWGGDVVCVPVSAKQRTGLETLLEMILLSSDMRELKANPDRLASGTVLEARLDRARGPVATVLISNGTLRVGDAFIVGTVSGKVRAMTDDRGRRVREVGPSSAVEIMGLEDVPAAGDSVQALSEDRKARQIGAYRQEKARKERLLKSSKMSLEHLFEQIKGGVLKELRIILKSDVQGSAEVLRKTLEELATEKVQVKVIHSATGAINDSDVLLAAASRAIVVGFNVRPEPSARALAEKEEIDIRLHTVIYNVTKEIKSAMVGLLEPTFEEVYLGRAEVRATFKVPKAGMVAGCHIQDGKILRTSEVRLLRDNIVIHQGRISSLRRFKEDVTEVKQGFECGIGLERFNDVKNGDVIEAFKMEKVAAQEL